MPSQLSVDELLLPIHKVAERVTGRRPSPATCCRWIHKGCKGAKLHALQLGNKWLCTESDFRRFMEEQTEAVFQSTARDDAVVDAALESAGLL